MNGVNTIKLIAELKFKLNKKKIRIKRSGIKSDLLILNLFIKIKSLLTFAFKLFIKLQAKKQEIKERDKILNEKNFSPIITSKHRKEKEIETQK